MSIIRPSPPLQTLLKYIRYWKLYTEFLTHLSKNVTERDEQLKYGKSIDGNFHFYESCNLLLGPRLLTSIILKLNFVFLSTLSDITTFCLKYYVFNRSLFCYTFRSTCLFSRQNIKTHLKFEKNKVLVKNL